MPKVRGSLALVIGLLVITGCGGGSGGGDNDGDGGTGYIGNWIYETTCSSSSKSGCSVTLHTDTYLNVSSDRFEWYLNRGASGSCIYNAAITSVSGPNPYTLALTITGNSCPGIYFGSPGDGGTVTLATHESDTQLSMGRDGKYDFYTRR